MSVAITQTANPAGVNSSGNVATYTDAAIGTASPERIVVVCVTSELTAASINSVTLGGFAMSAGTQGNQGVVYARNFYLRYPFGTTATIAVTFGANPDSTQNHISVYSVTGGDYSSGGGGQSTDMDASAPLSTGSTTIAANGGMIAGAGCATDTVAKTWANLTEDIDADVGSHRHTTATSTTAGTATRTCTGGTNGEDGAISWLIFTERVNKSIALFDSSAVTDDSAVSLGYPTPQGVSNSGVKADVANYSWNHTTPIVGGNKMLVVTLQFRDATQADVGASAVTYNSVAMTKVKSHNDYSTNASAYLCSEIWVLLNPSTGTNSIAVTCNGTVSHTTGMALSLFNALQSTTPNASAQGFTGTNDTNDPSLTVTTTAANCIVIDSVYSLTTYDNLSVGANQTVISSKLNPNAGGDESASSYEYKQTSGDTTMSWTTPGVGAGMDGWVSTAIAIAPYGTSTNPAINVYDTATASDVIVEMRINPLNINVSDTPTASDVIVQVKVNPIQISVFDSPTASDVITDVVVKPLNINVYEDSTVTDAPTVFIPKLKIAVYEDSTVSDVIIQVKINPLQISVNDTPTATDEIIQVKINPLKIEVNDSSTASDAVVDVVIKPLKIDVFDSSAVTELDPPQITINSFVAPTLSIDVSDTPTASDVITDIVIKPLKISVFDSPTASDAVVDVVIKPLKINVYDSSTVTDAVLDIKIPKAYINVFDSSTVTDVITDVVVRPLKIDVNDTPTTSDAVTMSIPKYFISVSDSSTVTDDPTVSPSSNAATISVYEDVTVTDSPTINIPKLFISVSDQTTVTDTITLPWRWINDTQPDSSWSTTGAISSTWTNVSNPNSSWSVSSNNTSIWTDVTNPDNTWS